VNQKQLIILDRPNPNGHYVDGPVLEKPFSSFVGKMPIPTVYGMTIGEYGKMIVGEGWIQGPSQFIVIPCKNYTHSSMYTFSIAPSPNLPTMNSIYWYPTTCLIEGTVLSEGRGTPHAFAYIGHPTIKGKDFQFTPSPRQGAISSKLYGQICYGWDLSNQQAPHNKIDVAFIKEIYRCIPAKRQHFHSTKIWLSY
jgi:hypothetical protein